ncbi:MAG: AbrB/MazE/SpoVT family DNA-binding domain-containing protein [Gemmatimonadota bacterium]
MPVESTRLSNKGQVVIPHRIRKRFGWEAGVEFTVEAIEGGVALRPVSRLVSTTVEEVYGCLPYRGPRKTLADMESAIRQGAREGR